MSSITVSWKGGCHEQALQEELLACIRLLARENAERWAQPQEARPQIVELMSRHRAEGIPELPTVREFHQEITGRILVCSDVVQESELMTLRVLAAQQRLPVRPLDGKLDDPGPFYRAEGHSLLILDKLTLRGIDFRLYDPRGLYPGTDRMSFVFLESEAIPLLLNGLIALVHDRDRCATSPNEMVRSADWYIECPFVHLRYYLEEWFADFLTWVQFFFTPGLAYFHRDELCDRNEYRRALEQSSFEIGATEAKKQSFTALIRRFTTEANQWTRDMQNW